MNQEFKSAQHVLLSNIESLKSNKNPLSLLFILADFKDIFINIGEYLLNSIELYYSREARFQYHQVTQKYRDAGIFEALYNYYLHAHDLKKFKTEIQKYFESSFFTDISFFFFTLTQDIKYKLIFQNIEIFIFHKNIRTTFFECDTYNQKYEYLKMICQEFRSITKERDAFFIIKFLNYFREFSFDTVGEKLHISGKDSISTMKKIVLYILGNPDENREIYEYILETFVNGKEYLPSFLHDLEEDKLFELILFLKNDIHIGFDSIQLFDFETKIILAEYLEEAKRIQYISVDEKIQFILKKENAFLRMGSEKGKYARIDLKRQLLESQYAGIIDLILGIKDIPVEVFYLLKQQTLEINLKDIGFYNEIKELIIYMDKSYILSFMQPFLLKNIVLYFNRSDPKYYIVKFMLCVILTHSYSEYKVLTRFFYNLEAFYNTTFEAYISRLFQFGWMIIFLCFFVYFLPFGIVICILLLMLRKIGIFMIHKSFPHLKMSLNFQFTTYIFLGAFLILISSMSLSYKDFMYLNYQELKPMVNAFVLPTHETFRIFMQDIEYMKVNILEGIHQGKQQENMKFLDIDYFDGPFLYELRQ